MAGGGACVPLAEALPHVIDTTPPPDPRLGRMGRGMRGCSIPITVGGRPGCWDGGCRGSLLLRFLTACLLLPAGSPLLPPPAAAAALGFGALGGLGSAVNSQQIHVQRVRTIHAVHAVAHNKHATEGTCRVLMPWPSSLHHLSQTCNYPMPSVPAYHPPTHTMPVSLPTVA